MHRDTSTANLISRHASSNDLNFSTKASYNTSGQPLRRFYFRTAVGVVGPILVVCYFIAIWRIYLAPLDKDSPLSFGPPGATWIFYSWFVAGVIGLNLSLYGLAGVEAAMLMEPAWHVSDAMRLMIHADNTWSGPGGWMKMFKLLVQTRKLDGKRYKPPGRLWCVLALPSILIFIAWPLSGLCLEMTSGYIHGTRGSGANVTGFTYANFNERHAYDAYSGAGVNWKYALDARIPGQGIMYSPEGFDRAEHDYLGKVPNVFPTEDGVSRMFLTAQATNPIEGNAWGLLLQYNCSIIEKISDLTMLKDRKDAKANGIFNSSRSSVTYYLQDNSSYVTVQNATQLGFLGRGLNINGVVETAYQMWPNMSISDRLRKDVPNSIFLDTNNCYYNKRENITGRYPGIDEERIFEIVVWQQLFNQSYGGASPQYDFAIDHNITDLYGAYNYRDFQSLSSTNTSDELAPFPMTAIGVQCKSSSSVGTADIDGVHSTYSNFIHTDSPINVQRARCAERFGPENLAAFTYDTQGLTESGSDWLSKLFTSSAAPPTFYASYTEDPESIDAGTGFMVQLKYLQAMQLRQSMLRAQASYAVQLMYDGGQSFTARDGSQVTSVNPNVTAFVAGTVITAGKVHPVIPVVLFAVWALLSSTLCLIYGFRKRWSAILDGHSLFRLGVGLDEAPRLAIQKHAITDEIEECTALNSVPGLVGDTDPTRAVGRIGLVKRDVADKNKLYQ
jgi:hypothetical protein